MVGTVCAGSSLLPGLALSGLSVHEMWLSYVALGGNECQGALITYMAGESTWKTREHDRAAHAVNEVCCSRGFGYPAVYGNEISDS